MSTKVFPCLVLQLCLLPYNSPTLSHNSSLLPLISDHMDDVVGRLDILLQMLHIPASLPKTELTLLKVSSMPEVLQKNKMYEKTNVD